MSAIHLYTPAMYAKKVGAGVYNCPSCGHPFPDWIGIDYCKRCGLPVVKGAAKKDEGDTYIYRYHRLCYKYKCFIATALYGEDSSKVQMLCFFRDEYLAASSLGRVFIALYVRFSPLLARAIAKESLLRTLVRYCIVAPALLFTEKFLAYAGRKDKLKQ